MFFNRHSIRHLHEDIKQLDSEMGVLRKRREIRRIEKKAAPRRIGKNVFKEEDIDMSMPGDIAGNLRNVKTVGSILTNTFKNMQRRNILAPTVDIGLRRRKEVKRFVRNSHKIDHDVAKVEQNKRNSMRKPK